MHTLLKKYKHKNRICPSKVVLPCEDIVRNFIVMSKIEVAINQNGDISFPIKTGMNEAKALINFT